MKSVILICFSLFCLFTITVAPALSQSQETTIPTIQVEIKQPKELGILGIIIDPQTGRVKSILPGSDGLTQGMRTGDQIIQLNGKPYCPATHQSEARGEAGTRCQIFFSRSNGGLFRFTYYVNPHHFGDSYALCSNGKNAL